MLTEAQYELLRRYEDTGPGGIYTRSWKALTNAQQRTLGVLLGQNLLSYEGDDMHAISEGGRQALAEFRIRHGLPVGA
ncbi:MAG: hypothetical protein M5T61_21605 [Acidimicrobiia bacterium]|nr:hypothetical protein [Acidimicrobiia bacterium]